jgi:hypothetical protein
MSQSVDTLEAETSRDSSQWFLREEPSKTANTILVDYHRRTDQ